MKTSRALALAALGALAVSGAVHCEPSVLDGNLLEDHVSVGIVNDLPAEIMQELTKHVHEFLEEIRPGIHEGIQKEIFEFKIDPELEALTVAESYFENPETSVLAARRPATAGSSSRWAGPRPTTLETRTPRSPSSTWQPLPRTSARSPGSSSTGTCTASPPPFHQRHSTSSLRPALPALPTPSPSWEGAPTGTPRPPRGGRSPEAAPPRAPRRRRPAVSAAPSRRSQARASGTAPSWESRRSSSSPRRTRQSTSMRLSPRPGPPSRLGSGAGPTRTTQSAHHRTSGSARCSSTSLCRPSACCQGSGSSESRPRGRGKKEGRAKCAASKKIATKHLYLSESFL